MIDDSAPNLDQSAVGLTTQSLTDMDGLSYEQYFKKVDAMVDMIHQHWKLEQRVKALKVIIQLAKLLADTGQLKLYPRKFKTITDALDEFGRLVYIRIHSLATTCDSYKAPPATIQDDSAMSLDFSEEQANARELAKETCRNWFLKVASIRELVPRFYIELAILKSYDIFLKSPMRMVDFLDEQFFWQSLRRLTKAACGFGDPVVALHSRAYLCKVAEKLIGWGGELREEVLFELISMNLKSSATVVCRLNTPAIQKIVRAQSVDLVAYFDLISSPLQSILTLFTSRYDVYDDEVDDDRREGWLKFSKIAKERLKSMLEDLVQEVRKDDCCTLASAIILHSAFRSMPADVIAEEATQLLSAIQTAQQRWRDTLTSDGVNARSLLPALYISLTSFIVALDGSEVFEKKLDECQRAVIFNSLDEATQSMFQAEQEAESAMIGIGFIRCFKALLSYANHYIERKEGIDKLLTRFVSWIKRNRQYANRYQTIIDIIKILFTDRTTMEEFKLVFESKSFMQLFDLLRKDEHKLEASKWILETMRANAKLNCRNDEKSTTISDKSPISFLLKLFTTINDSVSLLTALDDFEHLSQLVIFFLNKIMITDFKDRLEFFSRCRSSLGNLNLALEYLTRSVLQLPEEYRKCEKKRGLRQNFLNGCLAFAFITIPAINSSATQMELYIEGSRLALSYMSLSLADYYLRHAMLNLLEHSMPQESVAGGDAPTPTQTIKVNGVDIKVRAANAEVSTVFGANETNTTSTSEHSIGHIRSMLSLFLKYQDHVDLKHKLTLTDLIESSYKYCSSLMQDLKLLNCIGRGFDSTEIG